MIIRRPDTGVINYLETGGGVNLLVVFLIMQHCIFDYFKLNRSQQRC